MNPQDEQKTAGQGEQAAKESRPGAKEQAAKEEAAKKPSRDDVHEQREQGQTREGVVKQGSAPTPQNQADKERADWEGMGQPQDLSPPEPVSSPRTRPTRRDVPAQPGGQR